MSSTEVKLQFRRISKALAAQAEVAGGTGHASTTGKMRELLIQRFLKPHLPRTFEIRSGIIVDSKGKKSKQQDIVIVDTRLPVIDIGSDNEAILIAESVVATIEVKSHLGTSEIEDSLESIALTKRLTRCGEQMYKKGGVEIRTPNPHPILSYLFAYDGLNLETLLEKVANFAYSKNDGGIGPEAVCVLSKGVLLRSQLMPVVKGQNVILPPLKDMKMESQNLEKDALFAFYRRFIDDVMPLQMINIDLDGYYNDSGLE
jgi:hypothetical protein